MNQPHRFVFSVLSHSTVMYDLGTSEQFSLQALVKTRRNGILESKNYMIRNTVTKVEALENLRKNRAATEPESEGYAATLESLQWVTKVNTIQYGAMETGTPALTLST